MKKQLIIIFISVFINNTLYAENSAFFDLNIGYTKEDIQVYRIGYIKGFKNDIKSYDNGTLTGYYEASLNYWYNGDKNLHNSIYAIALSPVFVYLFNNKLKSYNPYVEAGIGATLLSETKIKNKNMSSSFQFEDRIGLGLKSDTHTIYFRFMHYSNGGLKEPNPGINILSLGVIVYF